MYLDSADWQDLVSLWMAMGLPMEKKTSQAQHGLDMLVDVGCILVAHNF
jgi:hypothetical protein